MSTLYYLILCWTMYALCPNQTLHLFFPQKSSPKCSPPLVPTVHPEWKPTLRRPSRRWGRSTPTNGPPSSTSTTPRRLTPRTSRLSSSLRRLFPPTPSKLNLLHLHRYLLKSLNGKYCWFVFCLRINPTIRRWITLWRKGRGEYVGRFSPQSL